MARSASSPLLSSLVGRWLLPSLSQAYGTATEQVLGTYYLGGNFGPVKDELKTVATNLPVTQRQADGKDVPVPLPADLTGAFVRTGPNPFFKPTGGYHWFDGDGMIHSVRLAAKAGGGPVTASYINRYVQTNRLQVEKAAKYPVMFKVGDLWKGWDGLSAIVRDGLRKWQRPQDYVLGEGQANTALTFHGNRLLSMNERDLPYYLQLACNGLLETIGRLTYLTVKGADGKPVSQEMTVHPKADSETGELWFFSYILNDPSKKPPWCRIGVLDKNGNVAKTADGTERRWQVTNAEPRVMHDWAVTKNFVFILQVPLTFTLYWQKMLTNGDSFPLDVEAPLGLKIGVMRKDNKPGAFEMKWFDLPPHMIFHTANAWEVPSTGGGTDVTVHLFSCNSMPPIDMTLESPPYAHPKLTRTTLTFDPNTLEPKSFDIKTMTEAVTCDFPIVAQHRLGLPTKYCWLGAIEPNPGDKPGKELPPVFFGIVKVDLMAEPGSGAAVKGVIRYPPNCFGGEAMYVPRDPNAGQDDDDGYLLSYVHDEGTNKSYLYIYDARTMSSKEVAKIEMPQRVPYGFHSTWLTEAQVKANLVPNPIPPAA